MEFSFDINVVLAEEITVIDSSLNPFKPNHVKEKGAEILKKNLEQVIDKMGSSSSKAQNLKNSITTCGKLSVSDHRLYLLKDSAANSGKGAVVGLIKVGKKRLFLIDYHSQQIEVNPLCVLDFYVHEQRQRSGCGLRLFKFMLEREDVKPQFLAYDRPSMKFLCFLRKHFDLQNAMNQMNKFVVFDLFFRDLSAVGYVPRNKRFVSSAPTDGRKQPTPESRQISSASSFGRLHAGSLSSLRMNDKLTILPTKSVQSNGYSCSLTGLPPKQPGKVTGVQKEASWNRRNGSNFSFARSSTILDNATIPERSSLYSRHSYRSLQQGGSTSNQSPTRQKSLVNNPGLVLPTISRREETKGQSTASLNNAVVQPRNPVQNRDQNVNIAANDQGKVQTKSEQSYSVGNVYKQNVQHSNSYGTSWNLFGVPANLNHSNNNSYKRNRTGFY